MYVLLYACTTAEQYCSRKIPRCHLHQLTQNYDYIIQEIKTFGLGSRIRDMALWDEPNVEWALSIDFLASNSPHNLGGYAHTVAINELLCMKNAGAQIAMDFS